MSTSRLRTALALFFLALVFSAGPHAQGLPATAAPALDTTAGPRPLLWLLEDDDSRVYLLGSIHALDAADDPLPGAAAAAYEEADAVGFELDLDAAQAEAALLLQAGMATDGQTLASRLAPASYARLDSALQASGMSAAAFDGFKPWLVTLLLTQIEAQKAGLTAENGVDARVFARAKADGKERLALETMAQQVAVFDGLTPEAQVALLESTIDDLGEAGPTLARLVASWRSGDAEDVAALMNEGFVDQPVLGQRLLRDRNAAWIPQIEALLAREGESVLLVVGAGHLAGPDSVVEMLRARGHTVTRL